MGEAVDAKGMLHRMMALDGVGRPPWALEKCDAPSVGPVVERRSAVLEIVSDPIAMTLTQMMQKVVEACNADAANLSRLIALIGSDAIARTIKQKARETMTAMPSPGDLSAGQCSIFDNWPNGRKPKRDRTKGAKNTGCYGARFKATIELWSAAEGTNIEKGVNSIFTATGALMSFQELEKEITKRLADPKRSRPWKAMSHGDNEGAAFEASGRLLLDIAQQMPDFLFGPLYMTHNGTRYYLDHYIVVEQASLSSREGVWLKVFGPNGSVAFRTFSSTLPNGVPLSANCVLHSRATNRSDLSGWATCRW